MAGDGSESAPEAPLAPGQGVQHTDLPAAARLLSLGRVHPTVVLEVDASNERPMPEFLRTGRAAQVESAATHRPEVRPAGEKRVTFAAV